MKTLEELRALYDEARKRVHETADAVAALNEDATPEEIRVASEANVAAVTAADEAKAEVDQRVADEERQAAIQRGREAHPAPTPLEGADPAIHARARGDQRDEHVYRPNQRGGVGGNQGFFHDLALAKGGDNEARERLIRNNKQVIEQARNDTRMNETERQERAGDLTTATHMGEFIKPDWTNELYAQLLRAGRPFADQCINLGAPVSNSWNLPRITTGATAAVQTEGSALSNTDQVSDSIAAVLQTIGGYSVASYQLVELAEPGMDQVLFADLSSAINQQVDVSLLSSTTTSAQGAFGLTGINSITYTQTTPTATAFWPTLFQAKNAIEKNTFVPVDFFVFHPSTWNWLLSTLDSSNRPLFTSTDGAAFNAMGSFSPSTAQGIGGNIDGIPVLVDANVTVTDGTGTNQAKVLACSRSALLKKEGETRFVATPVPNVTSLMWNFVAYEYLQRMFGRHPKKISAITGTGLVVQSGF